MPKLSFSKWIIGLSLSFPSAVAFATSASLPAGKSSEPGPEFIKSTPPPYTYTPVDTLFWPEVVKNLKENHPGVVIDKASSHIRQFGEGTLEGAEARLAIGQALVAKELYFAAYVIFAQLAQEKIGTRVGEAALAQISQLAATTEYVDEDDLIRWLNGNEFLGLHPQVQSFVSYFKTLFSLRFGLDKWAKAHRPLVQPETFWHFLLTYWSAVGEVARDRIASAKEMFKSLMSNEKAPLRVKELASLQYSRLDFEEGEFQSAYDLYTSLSSFGLRERGRIQLERAWTQYYLKEYGKAMGLLAALRAPLFSPSAHPERLILEMIIYKELCHYPSVSHVAKEFRNYFGPSLQAIKKRKPLREDRVLHSMAVMDQQIQRQANLIDRLRQEKKLIDRQGLPQSLNITLLQSYSRKDRELQRQLDRNLEDRARQAAEELLDAEEQVLFLEYTAKLDALRLHPVETERQYQAEEISYLEFDRVYWPVKTEHWTHELESYKMLISSRCEDTPMTTEIKKVSRR